MLQEVHDGIRLNAFLIFCAGSFEPILMRVLIDFLVGGSAESANVASHPAASWQKEDFVMQDLLMLAIAVAFRMRIVAPDRAERRAHGRQAMNGSELIGLVLSLGLLVYLVIALLKPEWFA